MLEILDAVGKGIEIAQTHNSNKIAEEANCIAREANSISQKANENAEKELRDSQKDYMPQIELVKGLECHYGDIEEICNGTVFDFHGGIICDENGELCLDDYSEYLSVFLQMENTGKAEINAVKIDSVHICLENKNEYEAKLTQGIEINKVLFETECNCKRNFVLKKDDKKEVILLFACEEVNWMDADALIEAANEGSILIEIDLKLYSLNNFIYEQKGLWCEYENGKAKECSYESIAVCE